MDRTGKPSFDALRRSQRKGAIVFCAFDLLYFDGEDVSQYPFDRLICWLNANVPCHIVSVFFGLAEITSARVTRTWSYGVKGNTGEREK